ncbi:MAG: hypothetical protein J6B39_00005, partial [Lachnospiraceae bacterium]|nr:hypothetical protein [Lachnospiraceae bacterium]
TASMDGVKSATATINSVEFKTEGGLTTSMPQNYKSMETIYAESVIDIKGTDLYAPSEDMMVDTTTTQIEGDAYTITVNGEVVDKTYAFKQNDTIGVQAALRPILYQIRQTGNSNIDTFEEKNGTLTLLTKDDLIIVKESKTFLQLGMDKEADLLSAAPELSPDNTLIAELGAILKYIKGVTFEVDDVNHIYKITVAK